MKDLREEKESGSAVSKQTPWETVVAMATQMKVSASISLSLSPPIQPQAKMLVRAKIL